VLVLTVGLALVGGTANAGTSLALKPLGGHYGSPTFVAQAPGSPRLLFVVEKVGKIAVARNGHELDHPFLDIRNRVSSPNEQGLLSMAFDPGYRQNGRFYVYYTNDNCNPNTGGCNIEVDGYRRSPHSATRARPGSRQRVIQIRHPSSGYHNGGQIQFSPSGALYIGTGDGATPEDSANHAQSRHSLLGKILRVDPRPRGGYTDPHGNPFVGKRGRDEIYARGLRNPYRFSVDRRGGDLWIGDVGEHTWEEVDHVTQAHGAGANFGWHLFEGPDPCGDCGFGPQTPKPSHYVGPVDYYSHSSGGCAIIGGYRVRDAALGPVNGDYLFTDNCKGTIRAYHPGSGKTSGLGLSVDSPSSFGEGLDGSIYVTSLATNKVYRLVSR